LLSRNDPRVKSFNFTNTWAGAQGIWVENEPSELISTGVLTTTSATVSLSYLGAGHNLGLVKVASRTQMWIAIHIQGNCEIFTISPPVKNMHFDTLTMTNVLCQPIGLYYYTHYK